MMEGNKRSVMPAQAGIQYRSPSNTGKLDPGLRRDDESLVPRIKQSGGIPTRSGEEPYLVSIHKHCNFSRLKRLLLVQYPCRAQEAQSKTNSMRDGTSKSPSRPRSRRIFATGSPHRFNVRLATGQKKAGPKPRFSFLVTNPVACAHEDRLVPTTLPQEEFLFLRRATPTMPSRPEPNSQAAAGIGTAA